MVSLGNSVDQDINNLVSLGVIFAHGLKHLVCIIYFQISQKQQETLYGRQLQQVHIFAMVQHTSLNEISTIDAQPTS